MRKALIFIIFCSGPALAQEESQRFSLELGQVKMAYLIERLEAVSDLRFYYDSSWIEELSVSANFHAATLDEILGMAFNTTDIEYFKQGQNIYLAYGVPIISKPRIASALTDGVVSKGVVAEPGLIFQREYEPAQDTNEAEDAAILVGNRSNMSASKMATIAGYIRKKESKEAIPNAAIYVQDPYVGVTSDRSGFFSITLPVGTHRLFIRYLGMKSIAKNLVLLSDGQVDFEMETDVIMLDDIMVNAETNANIKTTQMGITKISMERVKNTPLVLGEADITKVATTFAGVQALGEGSSGFNVRGGKTDQNLFLLNGAPIYNPSHFLGFFSVFNPDAISGMNLYKSGIPASLGGRLASVFDIETKNPAAQKLKVIGSFSPITSRLTVQSPVFKEKSGLMFSARTTYSNWILKRVDNSEFRENRVSFSDFVLRYDHTFDEKNTLEVMGYYSNDRLKLKSDTLFSFSDFSYRNSAASMKWVHSFNEKLDGHVMATLSNYSYELKFDETLTNAFTQDFGINDLSLGFEANYQAGNNHNISGGIVSRNYDINPGTKMPSGSGSIILPEKLQNETSLETSIYLSDHFDITPKLSLYSGIRYSIFNAYGAHQVFTYLPGAPLNDATRLDTITFGNREIVKTYAGPEWRFSTRYAFDKSTSVKFSYNRTRQFIHALSNAASLSPTDTWRTSNSYIRPQVSDQYAAGAVIII